MAQPIADRVRDGPAGVRLLATGELRYADVIERTLFNGVLSGLGADGTHFFYSNPLQRRSGGLEIVEGPASTRRAEWFEVSCCPPNLMRTLASLPGQLAARSADGLHLLQFATGSIEAAVPGGRAGLDVTTDYPWADLVEIVVTNAPHTPWTLTVRVPDWCPRAALAMADSTVLAESGPGSIAVTRQWAAGDRLALRLETTPRVTFPDARIDALRATIALERGPLVYAVEDADMPAGATVESLEVDRRPSVVETPPGPGHEGLPGLTLDAYVRDEPTLAPWPYPSRPAGADDAAAARPRTRVKVDAIPYFAWGRRAGLGMRVWLPTRIPEEPDASTEWDEPGTGPTHELTQGRLD